MRIVVPHGDSRCLIPHPIFLGHSVLACLCLQLCVPRFVRSRLLLLLMQPAKSQRRIIRPTRSRTVRHSAAGSGADCCPACATLTHCNAHACRLPASFTIPTSWTPQAKIVARALQKYGALVADNGQVFDISFVPGSSLCSARLLLLSADSLLLLCQNRLALSRSRRSVRLQSLTCF